MGEKGMTIYRTCTPVSSTKYGRESGRSPTEAIIDAVAEAAGVDPTELPPLYDSIDPDAINDLFQPYDGNTGTETFLRFTIDSWNVFVRADGKIRVCDATRPTEPKPVFDSSTVHSE